MLLAYKVCNYDLGVLTAKEKKIFTVNGFKLPLTWIDTSKIQYKVIKQKLILLIAPSLGGFLSFQNLAKSVSEYYNKLKVKFPHKPIIVISPWGYSWETNFLSKYPQIELLLGSGPGPGFSGELLHHKHTLWVRPFSLGKSVNFISILDYSSYLRQNRKWIFGKNIKAKIISLNSSIQEDNHLKKFLK